MPAGCNGFGIEGYWLRHWFEAEGSRIEIFFQFTDSVTAYGRMFFSSSPRREIGTVELPPAPFNFEIYDSLANFSAIMETLRYEKPLHVYLEWNDSNIITKAYIGTSHEHPGEQEGVGAPLT